MRSPAQLSRDQRADRNAFWSACYIAWAILIFYWVVDALSIQTEINRAGRDLPPLYPWVIEGSSIVAIMLAVPALMWLGIRFPLKPAHWRSSLPVHLAGFLAFTSYHIAAMILLREAIWAWGYGGDYNFFYSGGIAQNLIYEMRKDFATYAVYQIVVVVTLDHTLMRLEIDAARRDARKSQRLTLKSGGRTIQIKASEFQLAKAAANYVEIKLETGSHLARMTLAELNHQLEEAGIEAVRTHRSWLVNRAQIQEIIPTGQGDVMIKLVGGDTIPGSRRYRHALSA